MAPRTTSDERKRQKREAERRRQERIRNDPVLLAAQKEKERKKYQKRKETGKRKLVTDMTGREHRYFKRKWKKWNTKRSEKNAQAAQELLKEANPTDLTPGPSKRHEHLKALSDKKRRKSRREAKAQIAKLECKLKARDATVAKYKKRLQRISKVNPLSPRKQVKTILKKGREVVSRHLLSGVVVANSIREAYTAGSHTKKRVLRAMLRRSGATLRKYRLITHTAQITSRFFSKSIAFRTSTAVRGLQQVIKVEIQKFYERDDVSRMCPGKRDFVTLKKVKKQKRFLLDSMTNIYQKFLETSTLYKIGYSTFCKLRPFWVKPPKVSDRETCLCKIHANIEHLTTALYSAGAIDKKTPKEVAGYLCCDINSVACLQRRCTSCNDAVIPYLEFDDKPITYDKWMTIRKEVTLQNKSKKMVANTSKEKISSTLMPTIDAYEIEIRKYMAHEGIVLHQFREVDFLKKQLKENEALIHCDFSENWCTKYEKEIQSFHFGGSRSQITLHTVQVYYRADCYSGLTSKSICTLSKSMDHSPVAVWTHLAPVLAFLRESCQKLEVVHFLSDSPSTQYRNKTLFYLFCNALKASLPDLKFATWNYCASGHGKGAPDGIGGTLKRTADATVAQGVDVADFESFVATLQAKTRNIKLFVVEEEEISATATMLPDDAIQPFKGTMKTQQVVWSLADPSCLKMNYLSCLKCLDCNKFLIGHHAVENPPHTGEEVDSEADVDLEAIMEVTSEVLGDITHEVTDPVLSTSTTTRGTISDKVLQPGTYVLAKFDSEDSSEPYKYACRITEPDDSLEKGEIQVVGMRSFKGSHKEFTVKDNDICIICSADVEVILPDPKIGKVGRKPTYVFPFSVQVREK